MLDGLRTFCENYVNFVGAGSISLASGCAERSLIPPPLLSPQKRKGVFAGSHFGRLHIPRVRLRRTLRRKMKTPRLTPEGLHFLRKERGRRLSGFVPDTIIIPDLTRKMLDGLRTFCEKMMNAVKFL